MNLFAMPVISMTETLFGGLLAAAALFFISRRLGLPNFWAGILSGLLPFCLYLMYSSQHWPGGDVLTIHFVVYLATAGSLIVFGGMQRKKERLHWAPRLIIGFFICLVILNAALLSISMNGLPDVLTRILLPTRVADEEGQKVHTGFPGLIPHDQNKLYEPHLQQLEKQQQLNWDIAIAGMDKLHSDKAQLVTITLLDKQKQPLQADTVTIGMWRMANSRDDRKFVFKQVEPGIYQAEILVPDEGRWLSELFIQQGSDTYLKQKQVLVDGD